MILLLSSLTALGQSPPNDDFTNSTRLTGNSLTFTSVLDGGTHEMLENDAYGGKIVYWPATVWWSWIPIEATPVIIELVDLSTNILKLGGVNVWKGTNWPFGWFNGDFVGQLPFDTGRHPNFSFVPIPGEPYHFQATGPTPGNFTLRLTVTNAPLFVIQPTSQTVSVGGSVFFGVGVAGIAPFHYQWQFNGTNSPGEMGAILSLNSVTEAQRGQYTVLVCNSTGTNLSRAGDLFVSSSNIYPSLGLWSARSGTGYTLSLTGELGRSYRIETSTNLIQWSPEKSFPGEFAFYVSRFSSPRIGNGMVFNTNASTSFALPATSGQSKFFRAARYSPPNDSCLNNLKQLRFASELWALETKHTSTDQPVTLNIDPYFKNGAPIHCPLGPNIRAGPLFGDPQCFTPSHLPVEPDY